MLTEMASSAGRSFQDTLNDDRVLAGGVCWEKLEPLCSITVLGRFGRLQSEGFFQPYLKHNLIQVALMLGEFFSNTRTPSSRPNLLLMPY